MPKARSGDGSYGGVRASGTNGTEPSEQRRRLFPVVAECSHRQASEPCRQTQCRYHLEQRSNGEHRLKPTRDCALVVASEGEHTLEEVAAVLGVSDERVRQVEERALHKLRSIGLLKRMHRHSE